MLRKADALRFDRVARDFVEWNEREAALQLALLDEVPGHQLVLDHHVVELCEQ